MPKTYLKNNIFIISCIILSACTHSHHSHKPMVEGKVDVFLNNNHNICFKPNLGTMVFLNKKFIHNNINFIKYDLEQISILNQEELSKIRKKLSVSEYNEKMVLLQEITKDTKAIWEATAKDNMHNNDANQTLCMNQNHTGYNQLYFNSLTNPAIYRVYIRGITKDERYYIFLSTAFNYNGKINLLEEK